MSMMGKSFVSLSLSLLISTTTLFAHEIVNINYDSQRQEFARAEHALKKNDQTSFKFLAAKLKDYPLYPYLQYEQLKQEILRNGHPEKLAQSISDFEKKYPDFPFIKNLKKMWLYQLGKKKNWQAYNQYYSPLEDDALACYAIQAKYQLSNQGSALKEVLPLWEVGYSRPKECDPLFKLAQEAGIINTQEKLKRIQLSLIEKNFDLAHHLIKSLPKENKTIALSWEKLIKDPYLIFNLQAVHLNKSDKRSLEILTHSIQIIANREPEKALKWWQRNQSAFPFTNAQKAAIQRDIGVYLAHHKSPLARDWLSQLNDHEIDNTAQEWRIRLALFAKDYKDALKWISHLSPDKQKENEWRYWTAKANAELNNKQAAEAIYNSLSQERNYYGFLASLQLNKQISLNHKTYNLSNEVYNKVKQRPAIQRFYELQALGKTAYARVEWFRAADKMSEEEIIAAAKIAQKMKLYDMAIFTMSKANFKDDVHLRFPLAFYNEIIQRANEYNIDPAWVFAIARQESAFHTEAISHRGAMGLLQLLPSTAKALAKKHDIAFSGEDALIQPDKNIHIGSVYLKDLKERMKNSTIVATASYNAGPTRTQLWLPKKHIDADIWIENIPYRETREYVKNVMAFTSIYRMQLGHPSSFAMIMKPVTA